MQFVNTPNYITSDNNLNEVGDLNTNPQVHSSLNNTKNNKLNEAFVFENYYINDSNYQNNSQNNSKNISNSF